MAQLPPSYDIRDILVTVDSVSTPIYIDREPVSPDECITIYNSGSWQASNPKYLVNYPSIQIRSRANTATLAYNNLLEVFDHILGRAALTRNTTRYVGFYSETDIFELGRDDNNRALYAANFNLVTEPASVSQHRSSI